MWYRIWLRRRPTALWETLSLDLFLDQVLLSPSQSPYPVWTPHFIGGGHIQAITGGSRTSPVCDADWDVF